MLITFIWFYFIFVDLYVILEDFSHEQFWWGGIDAAAIIFFRESFFVVFVLAMILWSSDSDATSVLSLSRATSSDIYSHGYSGFCYGLNIHKKDAHQLFYSPTRTKINTSGTEYFRLLA